MLVRDIAVVQRALLVEVEAGPAACFYTLGAFSNFSVLAGQGFSGRTTS